MPPPSRPAAVALLLGVATFCWPCLNDRDSLYDELNGGVPDAMRVAVGWFPVHTPLYYQMRIAQSSTILHRHPEWLDLYDDIAVAFDRLGDDVHAIKMIEQKRVYMEAHGIKPKQSAELPKGLVTRFDIVESSKEPWYRYYANLGTFWAHRWFHAGMPQGKKDEWLGRAEEDIAKAVKLNPLAHGLREYAQLEAIRWVRFREPVQTLYEFSLPHFDDKSNATAALCGLVELGGAWESPDVFHAIAFSLAENQHQTAYFVFQRVLELQKQGKRSLTGRDLVWRDYNFDDSAIKRDFLNLRYAAEAYRKDLASYETQKLTLGKHPDTDPDFWSDYREPAFPDYGWRPLWQRVLSHPEWIIGALVLLGLFAYVRKTIRKKKRNAAYSVKRRSISA